MGSQVRTWIARRALVRFGLLLARPIIIGAYLRAHTVTKLHIGAGSHILAGWLNADLMPATRQYFTGEGAILDARQPFPLADQTFDYVFTEHMIEHLTYREGAQLLRECRRILKPNGMIRVATPDLSKIIGLAARDPTGEDRAYMQWAIERYWPDVGAYMPSFVINNFFYRWDHRFIYDRPTLGYAMQQAGFVDIVECTPGESGDACLRGLEGHGAVIGEDINRFETLVLEGRRPENLS